VAALHHPEVGDIDLIWGWEGTPEQRYEDGYGLAHILAKGREELVSDLQGILERLPVRKRSPNRIQLWDDRHRAAIRLDWDGTAKRWLLTLFEKPPSPGRTTDVSETPGESRGTPPQKGGSTPSVAREEAEIKGPEEEPILLRPATAVRAAETSARDFADDLERTFAPATRGDVAAQAALSLRAHGGRTAQQYDHAEMALRKVRKYFRGLSHEVIARFIDRMEEGRGQENQQSDAIAALFRKFLDGRRREMQALGEGKLTGYYLNYFLHMAARGAGGELGRQSQTADRDAGAGLGLRAAGEGPDAVRGPGERADPRCCRRRGTATTTGWARSSTTTCSGTGWRRTCRWC